MCVDTITDPTPDPKAKGTAWKVLEQRGDQLFGAYYSPRADIEQEEPWAVDAWYTAGEDLANVDDGSEYRAGIHVFCDREQAGTWREEWGHAVVRKVEWQGLLCCGVQEGLDALVVERARLVKE